MSRIDRLSIRGVRSFGPKDQETIKFNTPLTLIVGYNGSGKTTVIECLKYATTGQLPPNCKNGSFVHDPALASETEVLAQVRLTFRNAEGTRFDLARSASVTSKKSAKSAATRSFKTLDSSLVRQHHGEKTTMSTRVGQLNEMLLEQLGVSEAVIDSVIFCHQDESLWPMSEPLTLKKKFDEIFEAGKYTKAIDHIKKMRKAFVADLALQKKAEDYAKTDKEKGERSETKQEKLLKEIEKLRVDGEEAQDKIEKVQKEISQKELESRDYYNIVTNLDQKRHRRVDVQSNVDDLLNLNLRILPDSDAALNLQLAEFEEHMSRFDQKEAQYAQENTRLAKDEAVCKNKLNKELTDHGERKAEKANYETQLEDRIKLVKESATRHGIRGYEGDIEDHQIHEFLARIEKASREKKRELARVREANSDALKKAHSALTDIETRQKFRQKDKDGAKTAIKDNDDKIRNLQREIDRIHQDESSKSLLETDCTQLETSLKAAKSEYAEKEWESNLRKETTRHRELEDELEKLSDEQRRISQLEKDYAKLEVQKDELKHKQQALDTLISTYGAKIASAVGANWKPENLDRDYQSARGSRSKAVIDVQRLRDATSRELAQLDFKLKSERDGLTKSMDERKVCENKVMDSIEDLTSIEDYISALEESEKDKNTRLSDLENFGHLITFYTGCLETVQKQSKCKLCDHEFSDEHEKSVAMAKLQKKLVKNQEDAIREEFQVLDEAYRKGAAARPSYDTYIRLRDEIPALRKAIKKTEAERGELVIRLEEQDLAVKEAETNKTELEQLGKYVANITACFSRISELNVIISHLMSQQKTSSHVSSEEIKIQMDDTKEKRNAMAKKISNMRADKERAEKKISGTVDDLSAKKEKLSDVLRQLERKDNFIQQSEACKNDNTRLLETIRQSSKDLEALKPQIDRLKEELSDVRLAGEEQEKAVRDDDANLSRTNDKLQSAQDKIKKYLAAGGPGRLAECEETIERIKDELKKLERERSRIAKLWQELRDEKAHGEENKRCISDNIAYRRNLRALEVLAQEITDLESQNADEDFERLKEEIGALENDVSAMGAQRGTMYGKLIAKDEELKAELATWELEYRDAGRKYREAHIKVETTKAAIEDLGKYGSALDSAVMEYHRLKMEEINRIAGELWQGTYKGSDIDTILIRSDAEAKGSKNYRVCMVKSDVEMDMRGRCSAGQRVLASIIIRLALAECFGLNCGIIALDEPTTNLDSDNIRSLAKSLHDIIEARRAQKNFQLIVITHDEEFLKEMKVGSFADTYFRVSRNEDQKSIIRQQSILEVL